MSTLSNYASVKDLLVTDYPNLKDSVDVERDLFEIAESLIPVYDGDIIAEWTEMPNHFDDSWTELLEAQQGGALRGEYYLLRKDMGGIIKLMAYDLWRYYDELVREVWADLVAESDSE